MHKHGPIFWSLAARHGLPIDFAFIAHNGLGIAEVADF